MAKKKEKKIELKDCIDCNSSKVKDEKTYCKLKMKDEKVFVESAIVEKEDCLFFRKG